MRHSPFTAPEPAIAGASVSLALPASLRAVDRVTRWLADFCHLTPADPDLRSRMELAVYELVENVVKYGIDDSASVQVGVEESRDGKLIRLRTQNRADRDRLERAVSILTALRDTDDPVAYYDQLILDSAPKRGMSGLGLARIRVEGEFELQFQVDEDRLSISVQALLANGQEVRGRRASLSGASPTEEAEQCT